MHFRAISPGVDAVFEVSPVATRIFRHFAASFRAFAVRVTSISGRAERAPQDGGFRCWRKRKMGASLYFFASPPCCLTSCADDNAPDTTGKASSNKPSRTLAGRPIWRRITRSGAWRLLNKWRRDADVGRRAADIASRSLF